MLINPLPDLASTLRLQDQSKGIRNDLQDAAFELTTGQSADIRARTGGAMNPVFAIDADLARLQQTETDLALAAGRATAAQSTLGSIDDTIGTLGVDLLSSSDRDDTVSRDIYVAEAETNLRTTVSLLNTDYAGSTLFGGADGSGPATASADILLADVAALVAGAATPDDAFAAVDAYFDTPGGGFETNFYSGSQTDAAGAPIADGERITYLPRADDTEMRELLKGLALAAVADSTGFAGDPALDEAYIEGAGNRIVDAKEGLVDMRTRLGSAEERIDIAREATTAEQNALAMTRNDLVGVDQFDAAARLADLEGQLEALYIVTSRINSLSLTNFIR